ncbi:hypothetical protein D3C86_925750 [compost metagenome]
MQPQAAPQQIPVQQVPVQQPVYQQAPVQQPQQPAYDPAATLYGQQYQQAPIQQQVYQDPAGAIPVTSVGQPVGLVPQPQQFAQPATQPLSATPQAPADLAAVFGGQQQAAPQQAPQGNLLPSGREPGRPMPGKTRRTKAEMAEDAAMGIGQAPGEQSEDEPQQAPQQAAPQGFGQQPVQAPQQGYQQPAGQPQVIQGNAVDAFAGWDD